MLRMSRCTVVQIRRKGGDCIRLSFAVRPGCSLLTAHQPRRLAYSSCTARADIIRPTKSMGLFAPALSQTPLRILLSWSANTSHSAADDGACHHGHGHCHCHCSGGRSSSRPNPRPGLWSCSAREPRYDGRQFLDVPKLGRRSAERPPGLLASSHGVATRPEQRAHYSSIRLRPVSIQASQVRWPEPLHALFVE
jgi:hypothetical protein